MIIIPFADILAAANLKKIRSCLRRDGVIAYPTDTLYGLGGNFHSLAAMAKVDRLKGRADRPYSAVVGSLSMLHALAEDIPVFFREGLSGLLPGKFTFIFKADPGIDRRLLKNRDTIGIRLPDLPLLLRLIDILALPLVSTSVNRSGQTPLNDPQRIAAAFPEIDLLIDGGVLAASSGSTLVDITVTPPAIIRRGDEAENFLAALGRESGSTR
ncbi:MAG TPA: L-threonylcarbamoyladenylate synthase [Candidatus Binatia bacterium]|nr:L-threonylcarbamoyladenylate synthase [Candidatus Binatia bacterium]